MILSLLLLLAETRTVMPQTFYHSFHHRHAVLARVQPGDTIVTKTIDAGGQDEKGARVGQPSNPLTGPFYVEGAEPGDTLVVRLDRLSFNRNWGWGNYRLGLFSLTPESIEGLYSRRYKEDLIRPGRADLVPWDIDMAAGKVKLREPRSSVLKLEFETKPMLGCIGVAAPGDSGPASAISGPHGGNIDYNQIGEGATLLLPVYHAGALLFIGDAHALQADGEPTGTGIETSMDVRMTVSLRKKTLLANPRLMTEQYLISIASQPEFVSSLDRTLRIATSDMVDWLVQEYKAEPWAAHQLIGYQGKYDVVTVQGSMALRIPRAALGR
jgi:amidase